MEREKLADGYKSLLNSVKGVKRQKKELTATMFLRGIKYGESKIRLLVVGRAVNGWKRIYSRDPNEDFDLSQIITQWDIEEKQEIGWDITLRDGIKLDRRKVIGLEWVNYMLGNQDRGSTFWRLAKKVAQSLLEEEKKNDWTQYIAWTNLFKIAPADGGNPNGTLIEKQKKDCKEILKKELEILKPTHILVIAKTYHKGEKSASPKEDWWTEPFYDVFEEYCIKENSKIAYVTRPENRSTENTQEIAETLNKDFGIQID